MELGRLVATGDGRGEDADGGGCILGPIQILGVLIMKVAPEVGG